MARPKHDPFNDYSKPSTIDAALTVIQQMRDAHENALESVIGELSDLEVQVADANERADNALQCALEDLARVHIKLKAGRVREAIDDLDHLLQEHDGDCKARTSACAVMI